MASKRILKELKDIQNDPRCQDITVELIDDDLFRWKVSIKGPSDSPYAGGVFLITFRFPRDYPFKPPTVNFETKIYHPGFCDFHILCPWSPALAMYKFLPEYLLLMQNPDKVECVLKPEIAQLYKENRAQFEETAREWTRLYAMNSTTCSNE